VIQCDLQRIDGGKRWRLGVFVDGKSGCFDIQANARSMRVGVWLTMALFFLFWLFQRGLKPWLGTAVLLAVVFIVPLANLSFAAFGVFTKTVIGTAAVTAGLFTAGFFTATVITGLTFDVAFFTATVIAGLTFDVAFFTVSSLTSDVAFFTATVIAGLTFDVAFFTAGFFTTGATVLRAVGRRVSSLVADSAGLIQERWAGDFSIGSRLVLDEVAGVFRFGFPGITANLTERLGGGGGSIGGISGRRHLIACIW
jgi:hypothetical protein